MSLVQYIAAGRGPELEGNTAPATGPGRPGPEGDPDSGHGPRTGRPAPGPTVVALLSAFFPGLGDVLLGRSMAATLTLLLCAAGWLSCSALLAQAGPIAGKDLLPMVAGGLLCFHLAAAILSFLAARRRLPRRERHQALFDPPGASNDAFAADVGAFADTGGGDDEDTDDEDDETSQHGWRC